MRNDRVADETATKQSALRESFVNRDEDSTGNIPK